MTRVPAPRAIATTLVVVLLAAVVGWWTFLSGATTTVTAQFPRAVGVHPGSDVRVLGVRVGEVVSVTPVGDHVDVVLAIDDGEALVPADTRAVVIAPSVVADRYVQLTGGSSTERIADGAVVPLDRTATPIELDELYRSLDDLLTALGPDGANADGAFSELLDTGAANLDGNGAAFNRTVRDLADVARTLSGSEDDVFDTVAELQTFTTMLAANDEQVATVNTQLAQVSSTLAADREELAAALAALGPALADVQAFVRDNRGALQSNVDRLAEVTQVLVDQRASLAEALDVAPLAATNILGAFDPASGTVQGRVNLLEYLVSYPTDGAGAASAGPTSVPLPLPSLPGGR